MYNKIMDHMSFFKIIDEHFEGAYLFTGTEEYVKERALEAVQKLIAMPEMNVTTLVDPMEEDLILACETLPCFSGKRLVIVREPEKLGGSGDGAKRAAEYIARLPQICLLIFFERGSAKKGAIYAEVSKRGGIVAFDTLSPSDAAKWLMANAKRRGAEMNLEHSRYMVEAVGTDVLVLSGELDKLIAYVSGREITSELIDACVIRSLEYDVFDMVERFVAGDTQSGFRQLELVLSRGKSPSEVMGLIAWRLRKMYSSGRGLGQKLTPKMIRRAIIRFADADWAVKSGAQKDRLALEMAIMEVFAN